MILAAAIARDLDSPLFQILFDLEKVSRLEHNACRRYVLQIGQ